MVNVFIIEATGFIGTSPSSSLLRSGNHRIYGLARTPEKAKSLLQNEITPIQGSLSDASALTQAIENYRIDVVVDTATGNKESFQLLELLKSIGKKRLAVTRAKAPKLGFVYVSGTFVHGSSDAPVSDLTAVGHETSPTPPARLVAWRPPLEEEIISASDVLDTLVIRPSLV